MREILEPLAVVALGLAVWGVGWLFVAGVGRLLHWKDPETFPDERRRRP